MLDLVKKYRKIKAEALTMMQSGNLEGYFKNLLKMHELRLLIPATEASA